MATYNIVSTGTGLSFETVLANGYTNKELLGHYRGNELKTIYFGLADISWEYLGNLNESSYTLDTDTTGCYAIVTDIDSTKSVGIIKYTISENTSTSNRTITFKYKNTTLFSLYLSCKKNYIDVHFEIANITPGSVIIIYNTDNWDIRRLSGEPVKIDLICVNDNSTQTLEVYSNYGTYNCLTNTTLGYKYKLSSTCNPTTRKDTYTSNIKYNFYVKNLNEIVCHN